MVEGQAPACPPEFTEAVILQMGARVAIFRFMRQIHYTLYREDSDYVAQCLDYDVSSFGATKEEALAMLKEAVELYLDSALS
jgi:predicted RNase H-like HicB family nuclease